MNKRRRTIVALTILALVLGTAGYAVAQKKVKAYTSQTSQTFTNGETAPAHGLTVVLSAKGVVDTDQETGYSGPFRNVSGNDTPQLTLANPTEPIKVSGQIELVFRSYASNIKIKSWWWTDAKGKRLGKKKP